MFSSKSRNNYKPVVTANEPTAADGEPHCLATIDANQNLQTSQNAAKNDRRPAKPDTPKRLSYFSAIHLTKIFKSPSQFVHTTFGGLAPTTTATPTTTPPPPGTTLHALKKNATDDSKRMLDDSAAAAAMTQQTVRCNNANATVCRQSSESPRRPIDAGDGAASTVSARSPNCNFTTLTIDSNRYDRHNDDQLNSNVPSTVRILHSSVDDFRFTPSDNNSSVQMTAGANQFTHKTYPNQQPNQVNCIKPKLKLKALPLIPPPVSVQPISTASSSDPTETFCSSELTNITEETFVPAAHIAPAVVTSILCATTNDRAGCASRNSFLLHAFEEASAWSETVLDHANYFDPSFVGAVHNGRPFGDADQSVDVWSNVRRGQSAKQVILLGHTPIALQ